MSSALAGGYAVYGQDMLNGVDLAIEDFGDLMGWAVKSEGGDDACEGAPGVTVAELFSANPAILGVVGPMCSGSAVPASAIYGEHKVVMVTPSSTAVQVTARGFENLFRTVPNDDLQGKVTSDFLSQDLGLTKLAIVHDSSIYGQGIAEAVRDYFTAAGGTVTLRPGWHQVEADVHRLFGRCSRGRVRHVWRGGRRHRCRRMDGTLHREVRRCAGGLRPRLV
ncbi:MAG: branched-chain amino acid ABC transporter substrate-binding protein [Chloroflexi bacterium]|nr:branched-chain amino acid ABC transporter substrate-binding protein [Chloroflexota bacterium]